MVDMRNKNVLVTGANTGLGRVTAEALAGAKTQIWCASAPELHDYTLTVSARLPNARFLRETPCY